MTKQITHLALLSAMTSRKNFCIGSGKIAGADLSLNVRLEIKEILRNKKINNLKHYFIN